jgi:hypothetical protein
LKKEILQVIIRHGQPKHTGGTQQFPGQKQEYEKTQNK